MSLIMLGLAAGIVPAEGYLCPAAPEPSALQSANFDIPAHGTSISVGAAASFDNTRFAVQVLRPAPGGWSTLTVVRMKRGWSCNLHALEQVWKVPLDPNETSTFFDKVEEWQRTAAKEPGITLDGTSVEFRRDDDGKWGPRRASNGVSMLPLSKAALDLLRRHLPADEIPADVSWRWTPDDHDQGR